MLPWLDKSDSGRGCCNSLIPEARVVWEERTAPVVPEGFVLFDQ